jgi:hypothetical protein
MVDTMAVAGAGMKTLDLSQRPGSGPASHGWRGGSMRQQWVKAVFIVLFALTGAASALAQTSSAIVGIIKDESGGAMPGVTVEISSPALIGGTSTTVSGPDGRYRVSNLVPGSYTVVFSLEGFQTVKHADLALTSAFTATVDVTMKVGNLTETLTVTGGAPVVDVKTNGSEAVLTQQLLEGVPMGRTMGSIAGLAPGVLASGTSGIDVAGSRALINQSVQVHGATSGDTTWSFDGLDITSALGTGNPAGYYNAGLIEETSVITKALPAEVGGGGVIINFVHHSGSNRFHGNLFLNGTNSNLQWDNLTADAQAHGLKAPTKINKMYDVNPSFGGPIFKDRLWFYTSVRAQKVYMNLANQFNLDGSQLLERNESHNYSGSVTAQLSTRNRLTVVEDVGTKVNLTSQTGNGQCASFPSIVDLSATTKQPTHPRIGSVKWNSVLNSSMTLETGLATSFTNYEFLHGDFAGNDVTHIDLGTGVVWGSDSCETFVKAHRWQVSSVLAWIPPDRWGSHSIRTGLAVAPGYRSDYGTQGTLQGPDAAWVWQYRNGAPVSVVVANTPYTATNKWLDQGYFVQDSWTIQNRLTLNLGVRVERLTGSVPAQTNPAGLWVPQRNYPEIPNTPNWTTVVPRIGGVYDLRGNGKTALKASISKYQLKVGNNWPSAVNPSSRGTSTVPWNAPATGPCSPTQTATCAVPTLAQLDFSRQTAFSGGVNTSYAAGIRRPYQWESSVSLQHELMPKVGMTLSYFHRRYYDLTGTANVLVPKTAYNAVTITNPITGAPLTVYNQSAATTGQSRRVIDNYPGIENVYNGFEAVLDKRFSNNATALIAYTYGINKGTQTTSDLNNPNLLINNYGNIGNDSPHVFNASGTYQLPGRVNFGAHYFFRSGYPLQENYTVTTQQVPGLVQVTQSIQLVPRGEVRLGNLNLFDMRISRPVKINSLSFEPMVEIYNLLNNNAPTSQTQTVGPNLFFILESVTARVAKFGFKFRF